MQTFCDPDHIDLDHPEESGIGRPARVEADITIRTLCLSSLRASRQTNQDPRTYTPATDAAVLLERMALESAREHAKATLRTLDAIAEQERRPTSAADEEERIARDLAGRRGWELGR